jgi:hypothetical protein
MTSHACKIKRRIIEENLLRAMAKADKHGYTGFVSGRGGLFDDPVVKRLMRKRDALLKKC